MINQPSYQSINHHTSEARRKVWAGFSRHSRTAIARFRYDTKSYEVTTKSLRSHVHTLRSHSKSAIGFCFLGVLGRLACLQAPVAGHGCHLRSHLEVLQVTRSHVHTYVLRSHVHTPTKSLEVTSEACQCALKGSLSP